MRVAPGREPHVAIVGGGLAGLATAVALAGRGLKLTLIESRPRLGGRAGSFPDPATGDLVDNCQHVSMTCCTNLADFCRKVGTGEKFQRVRSIRFLDDRGTLSTLAGGLWPAPFHLTGSFLRARYLTLAERLRVGFGLACLRRERSIRPGENVRDWLLRHGQTARTIDRYWGTVLVSALNERLDRMDVGHARKVFFDGFLRHRDGYVMEVPAVPLGEIYGTHLERWLAENGVEVRLGTGVRSLRVDPAGDVTGVELRSGPAVDADAVVVAVPFDRVSGIVPGPVRDRVPDLAGLGQLEASPITGVHLWFDRPVCPYDHVAVVGHLIHWVFDHTPPPRPGEPGPGGQYLQLVISAAYDLVPLSSAEIRDAVLADLARLWPSARDANLVRWKVVTEHGATFAVRPGVDALRPPQATPVPGLVLAGDWTRTGWPATMEGAVRSGYRAAETILAGLGRPTALVQPDLPAGRLSRWLLGSGPEPKN